MKRQILVTVTYNDLGCIIDTKAEPYAEQNLQPTCNQLAADCISRQAAIDGFYEMASDMDHLCTVSDYVSFLESLSPAPQWIPCSERLPERIINGDVETVQEFFVTVKERWPGEEWKYHTDVAEFPGDYIDDVWQTYNDWKEGQEVHVIAWMPLPEPYKEKDNERA